MVGQNLSGADHAAVLDGDQGGDSRSSQRLLDPRRVRPGAPALGFTKERDLCRELVAKRLDLHGGSISGPAGCDTAGMRTRARYDDVADFCDAGFRIEHFEESVTGEYPSMVALRCRR
jgi:hypothetical protein